VLLIAPSVESIDRLPSLQPFYRVYSWLSPLRADSLQDLGRRSYLAAESRGQTALYAADSSFRLSSPDDELLDATHRGTIAARRLVLVGGETSALLLGFAIIARMGSAWPGQRGGAFARPWCARAGSLRARRGEWPQ
jgi:hypothetical protein